ncbi:ras-related protein Rab-40B-like isoform X1 [Apostichopus japonicus]|uniref:ras-related protein Rab-40B-like isoform X1 n=1 Tax=Stichopus japonicus TaxID=307972 RepID=UPI003AB57CD3
MSSPPHSPTLKNYDYLLKFLLVGDSDVGKEEILEKLDEVARAFATQHLATGYNHKTATIWMDGKRVKLQIWDTSGQGRFCTIFRTYSRGAHGILLVYDISNRWSFEGIDRWLSEVEEHAPGVPKILLGNRLHLAFKRQIGLEEALSYAKKHDMVYFEVSGLCDFNVTESLTELSRLVLKRNGLDRLWSTAKVLSLQDYCCRTIVNCVSTYAIDKLPLPPNLRTRLKSYADANHIHRYLLPHIEWKDKKRKTILNAQDPNQSLRKSCSIS